jgi:HEPN domain-containing protein
MPEKTVNELLKDVFDAKHVDAAVKHFQNMVADYQKSDWADASAKAGKFIEAVMKALWVRAGEAVPKGKDFKVGKIITDLERKPDAAGVPDTVKLTIPRACRFAYEIASNRGARHDPDEIDANEMDASTVVSLCSWILSEMVRFSQKGLDLAEAKRIVEGLMRRKFPLSEEIDGRIYTQIGHSAPEVAIGILFEIYPKRMAKDELVKTLKRHEFGNNNANIALVRIKKYVDIDDQARIRLRNTGVQRVDELISAHKRSFKKKR